MKIIHLFLCLTTLNFISCKGDDTKKINLNGRWDLKSAELNGQPAPSLERIYFDFNNDNLTTNFNEATRDETTPFEVKEDKIIKKTSPKLEFSIQSQTDSVLELTTEMRGFDFKLVLVRGLAQ